MRGWLGALIFGAAALFLFYAATLNNEPVGRIDWVFGEAADVPLWRVLATSAALGAALAATGLGLVAVRLRFRVRRAERRIAELEREVHGLRTLPLEEVREPVREV